MFWILYLLSFLSLLLRAERSFFCVACFAAGLQSIVSCLAKDLFTTTLEDASTLIKLMEPTDRITKVEMRNSSLFFPILVDLITLPPCRKWQLVFRNSCFRQMESRLSSYGEI